MDEFMDDGGALVVPADLEDREIEEMVERLFVEADDDRNFDRLELVGERAIPFVRRALEDPRACATRFAGGDVLAAESPFERICALLGPEGAAGSIPTLAALLSHDDAHVRSHSALALAEVGAVECIAPVRQALADDDAYVRSYAMIGMQRGVDADRGAPEFLDAMFPALVSLLDREDPSSSESAPQLLLAIDRKRAVPVLLSARFLSPDNVEVRSIIRALNGAEVPVPHDVLLPFMEAVRTRLDETRWQGVYADALKAYARNPDDGTEATLRGERRSPHAGIAAAATEAMAIWAGVGDPLPEIIEVVEEQGVDALSPAQQHYFAVFMYDAGVRSGGHARYFAHSTGGRWRHAAEGLGLIGAPERAAILTTAAELFGPAGPPSGDGERRAALSRMSRRKQAALDACDELYQAGSEDIDCLLSWFAVEHGESFRPRP